jgi:hypothetical protein
LLRLAGGLPEPCGSFIEIGLALTLYYYGGGRLLSNSHVRPFSLALPTITRPDQQSRVRRRVKIANKNNGLIRHHQNRRWGLNGWVHQWQAPALAAPLLKRREPFPDAAKRPTGVPNRDTTPPARTDFPPHPVSSTPTELDALNPFPSSPSSTRFPGTAINNCCLFFFSFERLVFWSLFVLVHRRLLSSPAPPKNRRSVT